MPHRDRPLAYAPIETALGRILVGYRGDTVLSSSLTQTPAQFASALGERHGRPPRPTPACPINCASPSAPPSRVAPASSTSTSPRSRPSSSESCARSSPSPRGQTCTYGELAERVGAPRAARAVGSALARNPVPLLIPCHRVVRSGGDIGKYGMGGAQIKKQLLRREGALGAAGRVVA